MLPVDVDMTWCVSRYGPVSGVRWCSVVTNNLINMAAPLIWPTFSADHEQRLHFYKTSIFPICKWCSSNLFDGEIWFVKRCFYSLILDLPLGIYLTFKRNNQFININIVIKKNTCIINFVLITEEYLESFRLPTTIFVLGWRKKQIMSLAKSWTKMRRMHYLSLLAGMLSRIVWVILQLVGRDSPLDYYRLISAGVGSHSKIYYNRGWCQPSGGRWQQICIFWQNEHPEADAVR